MCETYGILSEGQLFASRFTSIKNSDNLREDELVIFRQMIQKRVSRVFARFRREFFKDFGGYESNTRVSDNIHCGSETFRRICTDPDVKMRQKASAYYRVAYTNQKYLSFGWLVADIHAQNRQKYLLKFSHRRFSYSPLYDRLSEHIKACLNSCPEEFENFKSSLLQTTKSHFVAEICKRYKGLHAS